MGVIVSNDYFYINGVRCDSSEIGLSCDTPPIPAMSVQDYTEWMTGADVPKASPDGTFQNVSYTLTARVFLDDSPHDNSAIYAYFANARTLTISRLPDYYFKIQKVDSIQPTVKNDGKCIVYRISLTLAPFRYFINNSEVSVDSLIENPGNRYSRPLYKITGRTAGATVCNLIVNGKTFSMKNLADSNATIFIDADRMLVYDQSNTNLIMKTDGQLPFLAPGINTVSVSDGALSVIGNWRSY